MHPPHASMELVGRDSIPPPEMGIRAAMGASAGDNVRLIVASGGRLVLAGVPTFAGAVAILATVALLSCYIPARRAARLEPVSSLRSE